MEQRPKAASSKNGINLAKKARVVESRYLQNSNTESVQKSSITGKENSDRLQNTAPYSLKTTSSLQTQPKSDKLALNPTSSQSLISLDDKILLLTSKHLQLKLIKKLTKYSHETNIATASANLAELVDKYDKISLVNYKVRLALEEIKTTNYRIQSIQKQMDILDEYEMQGSEDLFQSVLHRLEKSAQVFGLINCHVDKEQDLAELITSCQKTVGRDIDVGLLSKMKELRLKMESENICEKIDALEVAEGTAMSKMDFVYGRLNDFVVNDLIGQKRVILGR